MKFSVCVESQWVEINSEKLFLFLRKKYITVKLGNKERFDKEQICIKEPFPVANLPFIS